MTAIRPARAGDALAISAIYAPHVVDGVASFETAAPDAAAMAERMAASGGLLPWLVATDGKVVQGYAYAARFHDRTAYRWTVETTIYVAGHAQGAGVGRLLYGTLLATLRLQGFTQAIGVIALPNHASVRLHETLGFRPAGAVQAAGYKHGGWIDVGYWQCPLAEAGEPPAEPEPFAAVAAPG